MPAANSGNRVTRNTIISYARATIINVENQVAINENRITDGDRGIYSIRNYTDASVEYSKNNKIYGQCPRRLWRHPRERRERPSLRPPSINVSRAVT